MTAQPDQRLHKRLCWLKYLRHFACDGQAASAVEFALVALPLVVIIFAALQFSIVLLAQQELNHAADETGRAVMTGQISSTSGQTSYLSQTDFQKKVCSYLVAMFNCSNVMVNMQTASSFSAASTSTPNYATLEKNVWSYQTGSHGATPQVIVLQVMYEWPIFSSLFGFNLATLPNGTRLLVATSVFMNEPLQ
ncbi:TadE/TadG family type IV pilus assembly protein [Methyloferula stellata]|uniref:TadE/TadG family type IV pilus assembly protein n=1 Tax=Methyloferula stellata TaxID=876270 RepID=UPI001268A9A2|nr:TadE/TadG family type IV pilus assembly protein [Methyloferula stellata]